MKIKLNMVDDISCFIKGCEFYNAPIYVKQGHQTVNAKSQLGVYSLNLAKPIEVEIDTENKNLKEDFYSFVRKWEVANE